MARRLRSPTLETRAARLRLKVRRKPYFISVSRNVGLGYRRNLGPGSWLVRCADGRGGAWTRGFAAADDFEGANGDSVLDFWTAQIRARELARGKDSGGGKPISVDEAITDYSRDLANRGGLLEHIARVRKRLTPTLLARPVGLLVARDLRRWRDALLAEGLAPGSVTRLCKAFKAALNYVAAGDPSIANRAAWSSGLASVPDSQRARANAVLPDDEIRAIVRACYAASERLGLLAELLALSGCRPIQAARLRVEDLKTDFVLLPRSAKGKGHKRIDRRPLPLPPGLIAKLRAAAGDRPPDAPLLQRPDGKAWQPGRSDHSRPFERALAAAGLPKNVPYCLRHSSVVRALTRGLSAQLVSDLHDTSPQMLAKHYAAFISDYSIGLVRKAQIDLDPPPADGTVVPLAGRARP